MASLLEYDIRHRAMKRSFSTQRYSQSHQVSHEEIFPVINDSDNISKRLTSACENAKIDDSIASMSFTEWEMPCANNFFPGLIDSEPQLDPAGSCAMPSIDRQILPVSSSSMLPMSGYSSEDRMLDVEQHPLVTSMGSSPAGGLCMDMPMLQKQKLPAVPKFDSLFSSVVECEMVDAANNWQSISGGALNDAKGPGLAEMFVGYTVNESQGGQGPPQFPLQTIVDNHGSGYGWPQVKQTCPTEADSTHQRYNHQFQFVGYAEPSQSDVSTQSARGKSASVQSVENLPPKPSCRSEPARRGSKAKQQLGLSRTMPSRWRDWSEIRISMRNNHLSGLAAQDKQGMLKRILFNVLPMIDKTLRQKNARKHVLEDAQHRSKYDHGSNSAGRARIAGDYTATPVQNNLRTEPIQDPAAKTHMLAERRRRHRENEYYAALRALIAPTSRLDKAAVLGETIKLVDRLKEKIRTLQENGNQPQTTADDSSKGNPSVEENSKGNPSAHSTSDHSPNSVDDVTASLEGSEHSNEQAGVRSPTNAQPATDPDPIPMDESKTTDEPMKVESASDQDPSTSPPAEKQFPEVVKEEAELSHEEILEVLSPDREPQNQLRVKVHTSKRAPDTVIHMLICFKELALQVTSSDITMNRDWTHANFHLQMNEDQSRRSSLFRVEVQAALKMTMARRWDFGSMASRPDATSNVKAQA